MVGEAEASYQQQCHREADDDVVYRISESNSLALILPFLSQMVHDAPRVNGRPVVGTVISGMVAQLGRWSASGPACSRRVSRLRGQHRGRAVMDVGLSWASTRSL